jgi:hypothetical protein
MRDAHFGGLKKSLRDEVNSLRITDENDGGRKVLGGDTEVIGNAPVKWEIAHCVPCRKILGHGRSLP